jgi:hypothetical protein
MSINPVSFINLDVGQKQAFEKQLTKLNTDVAFLQVALGEGPVYRINPNGIQDIRIDDKFIDDLIDETNNADPYVFSVKSVTGTINQDRMVPFGNEVTNEVRFSSPIVLTSGQAKGVETGIPQSNVSFFATNSTIGDLPIDTVVFKFNVNELYRTNPDNNNTETYQEQRLDLRLSIHPISETSDIDNYIALRQKSLTARITFPTTLEIPVHIPDNSLSTSGYRVTVLKGSDDAVDQEISAEVEFIGFDEISHKEFAYPRTALIGYALKATNFRSEIPDFSSLVKGLVVKVPSNYNQPILDDGQIDWREVEVNDRSSSGYKLQDNPDLVVTETNPIIYSGIWDGTFKYDWTQNPVWIIYDLLTNSDYGLGIDESLLDKFNFYKMSQYCDGIDPNTGRFHGVAGTADGSFRYKPRNEFISIIENQIGLGTGISVSERRFICDLTVAQETNTLDLITKIAASMRGIIQYSGNKISLSLDMPNQLPVHSFSDVNMISGSLSFSGIRKEETITGVDIIFNDAANGYLRETIRVDDPDLTSNLNETEKIIQLELTGCTRRSQAVRFGQYLLASSKYIRRKASFSGVGDPEDLTPGDIVALSTQVVTNSYGYNGIVQEDSPTNDANVYLQHLGYPSITSDVFAANTNPLVLRHFCNRSNMMELYLVSNTNYELASTGNTSSGTDYADVTLTHRWNPNISEFETFTSFKDHNKPQTNDIWSLGEIDPDNIYSGTNDKLFRVDTVALRETGEVDITASEYISNVYIDSETVINYEPTPRKVISNPFVAPNPPGYQIKSVYTTMPDGSVRTRLVFTFQGGPSNMLIQKAYVPSEQIVGVLGIV